MSTPAATRRQATRSLLVELAEKQIAENGIDSLRARDLASAAGIAVGAIYTHFKDLDALVLEVNARSFRALGSAVQQAAEACEPGDATGRLIAMAQAYHQFARDKERCWQALFENRIVSADSVPAWYQTQVEHLFSLIGAQVASLRPDLAPARVSLLARGLFGSAHGIISLSIQNRISAVPEHDVPQILEIMIRAATTGDVTSA